MNAKRLVLLVGLLLAVGGVLADIKLQNQGTDLGPVTVMDFRGPQLTVTRDGSVGYVFCDAGGGSCATCATCDAGYAVLPDAGCTPVYQLCDAGYALQADAGCDYAIPACSPNLGRNTDGGCIRQSYTAPQEFCNAFWDAGALANSQDGGGWWCLKGDQTMLAGSSYVLVPSNRDGGVMHGPVSWPIFPGGTLMSMTPLNDYPLGTGFAEYFQTDGGSQPPARDFTTCALSSWNPGLTPISNPAWNGGTQDGLVRFGTASAKWSMETQGTPSNGMFVTCSSCGVGNNLVREHQRVLTLHCAVFTASDGGGTAGSTKACTYIPGDGGMTCLSAAHGVQNAVGLTKDTWYVGLGTSGFQTTSMLDGMFVGAVMTQKAMTTSEMAAIGHVIVPSAPSGTTFSRLSSSNCCDSSTRCTYVPPDVPCAVGAETQVRSWQMLNNFSTVNAEAPMNSHVGAVLVSVDGGRIIGPFGMTTMYKYEWGATSQTTFCDGGAPRDAFTNSYVDATNVESCTAKVMGTAAIGFFAAGAPFDYGWSNPSGMEYCFTGDWTAYGGPASTFACDLPTPGRCTPPSDGGIVWCELQSQTSSDNANGNSDTVVIGNLTDYIAPYRTNGPKCRDRSYIRVAGTSWITGVICSASVTPNISTLHDYSTLGPTQSRSIETCSGPACP